MLHIHTIDPVKKSEVHCLKDESLKRLARQLLLSGDVIQLKKLVAIDSPEETSSEFNYSKEEDIF